MKQYYVYILASKRKGASFRWHDNGGFTLIEVLVSLTILGIMLFSLASVEMIAVRNSRDAFFLSVAVQQLEAMAEQIRAQQGSVNVGQWNLDNQKLLPRGKGTITGNYPFYTLKMTWNDSDRLSTRIQL